MQLLTFDLLLHVLQDCSGASQEHLAEWLDIDVATISRHMNRMSGWRKTKDLRQQWIVALNKCRESFGNNDELCCKEICRTLNYQYDIDANPYRKIFQERGFPAFAEALVSDAWFEKTREIPTAENANCVRVISEKEHKTVLDISPEKQVAAIRAYSDVWTSIDRLFLKPQLLRIKPFFYELRHQLPPEKDIDLGIAMSLRIRDGIQYSQGLLSFIPNSHKESHYAFQEQIMSAEITKLAVKCYKFEWEETSHPVLEGNTISVDSIVAFSKYWTDIGETFLEERNAHLRKYFFEAKDRLPDNKEDFEAAKVIAEMYRDAMMYSELLLDTIPFEFRRSYHIFKRNIMESKIIKASMENKFKYEEGLGY